MLAGRCALTDRCARLGAYDRISLFLFLRMHLLFLFFGDEADRTALALPIPRIGRVYTI